MNDFAPSKKSTGIDVSHVERQRFDDDAAAKQELIG
jgi:hypothetical protein